VLNNLGGNYLTFKPLGIIRFLLDLYNFILIKYFKGKRRISKGKEN